jgi:hypothetical protein
MDLNLSRGLPIRVGCFASLLALLEASTVAAIVFGEFVAAHEALGRTRPE